jgi:serine/threonine protein kinase
MNGEESEDTSEKQIGKYLCFEKIATGSYGTVYKGKHKEDGTVVALKIVNLYTNVEHGVAAELLREFSFLHTLRHKPSAILFPIDLFIEGNSVILIYPFMQETLFHYLIRTTSHDRRQNIQLFQYVIDQIIDAMHFCAHYNIRHNDVHASNVLVDMRDTSRPIVKLGDLGLCTYEPALPWLAAYNMYEWAYYQAPELAHCLLESPNTLSETFVLDSRIDVWGLGVMILEYGAPQAIKDEVKNQVYPQYMYNPRAHPTKKSDPQTLQLSLEGSSKYYYEVIRRWKRWMSKETAKQPTMLAFYQRLFVLLQNIFVTHKLRWNIRACHEYWIEHKCKLVIHNYTPMDHGWLSKFVFVLHRFQQRPFYMVEQRSQIPIWSELLNLWYEESENIIYVLECIRLLYDYLCARIARRKYSPDVDRKKSTCAYAIYEQNQLVLTFTEHDWNEMNQTLIGLVYKILHNSVRPRFKVNSTHERAFLQAFSFNIWSTWIQAPTTVKPCVALSFLPKHCASDIKKIQSFITHATKS